MILFEKDEDCCGCSACEAICPKHNIKMIPNTDGGYYYPLYLGDENCINCNLCLEVCPPRKGNDMAKREQVYYAGTTKDRKLWEESTSGGAFSEICRLYQDENPVIFGARWDDDFNVVMDYVEGVENMAPFRRSKYVAANPNMVFKHVKAFLNGNRTVIFSGTPCQIAGLKCFLKRDYEKLITIDFACHGQGAPHVFKAWKKHLENKYKLNLIKISFREKKYIVDHVNSNCTGYVFADGKKVLVNRDYYHHAFVYGFHMRKSCADCKFSSHNDSDITLADFKSPQRRKLLSRSRTGSDIVCNTPKGIEIGKQLVISMNVHAADYRQEILYNPKLVRSVFGNKDRDSFMQNFYSGVPIDALIKKYAKITPIQWIDYNMPTFVNNVLVFLMRVCDFVKRKLKK